MNIVLNRLKEITSAVIYAAEATDIEEVLERIAQVSREIARTKYAALGIPDGKGGLKHFKFAGMNSENFNQIGQLPEGKGLLGAIMHSRKPIRLERMQEDSRFEGFPNNHPRMQHFLGVPIQVGQHLYGIFYLADREDGQPFTKEDEVLVETMAGYAALAIAGAELVHQKSRLKLLEERERIGMELHDGVIQSLYALGMHLDLIRANPKIHPEDLNPIISGLNDVIEDIRRYIMDLRTYKQKSIHECLSNILNKLHLPDSIHIEIDAPRAHAPFSPSAFEGICLMVNEAISNAMRHANASTIKIKVWIEGNTFNLKIIDNGRGFDMSVIGSNTGLGLRNMQQRARIYSGSVDIKSAPGMGTVLTIQIPIGIYY